MEERLQKYMARCGVASRRKCEEIILDGKVQVNGKKVTELGQKIDPDKDIVIVSGKKINIVETKLYIALNKPTGYISSVKDERNRKTVIDIINIDERIYPIGRLDYDTSGLILLTNDGDVYNKIIHPRVEVNKVYVALVKGVFTDEELKVFEKGVDIGDYVTAPAKIKLIKKYKNTCEVEIIIHEGKNRQVRRMCEAVGHTVIELKRVRIGEVELGKLPEGEWRNLTGKELNYINSL